ncbi:hypothetical protein AVEN_82374-1, partial [Araneus ventricosus]
MRKFYDYKTTILEPTASTLSCPNELKPGTTIVDADRTGNSRFKTAVLNWTTWPPTLTVQMNPKT